MYWIFFLFSGTGYNLTLVKSQSSSVLPITDTIKSHVAGAVLKTTHSSQLLYTVPQQEAGNLSSMFKTLENKKSELGITSVGITCTTMEDVFLRFFKTNPVLYYSRTLVYSDINVCCQISSDKKKYCWINTDINIVLLNKL